MSTPIYALERCETYGLSPHEVFKNQILISAQGAADVPGLAAVDLNNCTLHAGSDMPVIRMEDSKGRLYGAFIGVGVDRGGARVSAEGFRAFNSKSPLFNKTFGKFIGEMAGRFAVLLDVGKTAHLLTDPMGHMALFYNPHTRLAATAEYLTLDRPAEPGPLSGTVAKGHEDLVKTFPMGHGLDANTSLLLGGHGLDLISYQTARVWPANMSLRKVTRAKSGPVIEQMARRLKTVVGALARSQTACVTLNGGLEDRVILAAMKASGAEIAQTAVVLNATEEPSGLDAMVADRAGYPLEVLSNDEARERFANAPPERQDLKQVYWVRTGCALRVPGEARVGVGGLRPQGALALSGAGLEALQGGWTAQSDALPPPKPSLNEELATLLSDDEAPQGAQAGALEDPYKAWKSSLPKSFQSLASDFIRLEMHEPARAVAWHGEAAQFTVSPFSDRLLIEQALRLPSDMRRGPALVEALLAKLAPELANLPYPGEENAKMVHAAA